MKNLTFLFLFFSHIVFASFEMNDNMKSSYAHIIDLDFNQASVFLNSEKESNPENGIIILNENYIDFLSIIINTDKQYYINAKRFKKERLEALKSKEVNSPFYLYSQAEIHLQWAFIHLQFKQYQLAVFDFLKAYNLLDKNKEEFPSFKLNNKSLGLLNVLLGSVPDEYKWILNLTGINPSFDLGIQQMESLLQDTSTSLYNYEIIFLISFLELYLSDNNDRHLKCMKLIGDKYKTNLLLTFVAARLSYKLGLNDYSIEILENKSSFKGRAYFYHLDYLLAMSYLYKLEYDIAYDMFQDFIINNKNSNYVKSAYHKLSWISWLQGDGQKMRYYFKQVSLYGVSFLDEDKKAQEEAEDHLISHPLLLEARLLYDGGYYKNSLSTIEKIDFELFSNINNQIEYWYRLARVTSKLGYPDTLVINYYKNSYEKGEKFNFYFAPNSALNIGLLYEKNNDLDNATIYFKKCLDMSGFRYEKSIHRKAALGLRRIKD